jgi:hypothetical protein
MIYILIHDDPESKEDRLLIMDSFHDSEIDSINMDYDNGEDPIDIGGYIY